MHRREGRRRYCKLHLEVCPRRSNRARIKRCHWWIDGDAERRGRRCPRPVIYPVWAGLCSVHSPDSIRMRKTAIEDIVGESEDPMKELAALGHKAETTSMAQRPDYKAELDRRLEKASIDPADGARALKQLLEAKKFVRTKSGDIMVDDDGNPVTEFNGELLLKVLVEFRDILGLPATVTVTPGTGAAMGGLNIQVGIIVPPKKPIAIDATIVDAEDE